MGDKTKIMIIQPCTHCEALRREIAELRTLLEETSDLLYVYVYVVASIENTNRIWEMNELLNRIKIKLSEPAP